MSIGVYVVLGMLGVIQLLWLAMGVAYLKSRKDQRFLLKPTAPTSADTRLVSVVIPARNESGSIGRAVRSVLAQSHERLELIVVDDDSTDNTAEEAREAAANDARARVVAGTKIPDGWLGKPWACRQGAEDAEGDLLLFVDADVVLSKHAVSTTLATLDERNLDMLSVWGTWLLQSFWERVAQPVVGGFVRGSHPLDKVNDPNDEAVFANGQFIAVTRDGYERLGKHDVVRGEVLEDVRLAGAARKAGVAAGMFFGPDLFAVRLYDSLGSLWQGSVKNFYHGMNQNLGVAALALVFVFTTALLPALALLVGLVLQQWAIVGLSALILTTMHAFRLAQDLDAGRSVAYAFTHVLGAAVLTSIIATSALRGLGGTPTEWKGRAVT